MGTEYNKDEIIKFGNISALKERQLGDKLNQDINNALWWYKKILFDFGREDYPPSLNREEIALLEKIAAKEEKRIKNILQELRPAHGDYILDCGCGPGTFSIYAAREGARVVALDIDDNALKIAKLLSDYFGVSQNITFISSDLKAGFDSLKDKFFNKIIFADVIEHIENEQKPRIINMVFRLLKPGGKILIHTDNPTRVKLGVIFRKVEALFLFKNPTYYNIPWSGVRLGHVGLIHPSTLSRMLKQHKLKVKIIFDSSKIPFLPNRFGLLHKIFTQNVPFFRNILSGYIVTAEKL
ncbi:MAG: methyltransferase domain-containing protein [Candidatus Omnitrophota bacterium]|nr:methyltransferase domain-containing protein [Candidatus Omnitrophota bacterium]